MNTTIYYWGCGVIFSLLLSACPKPDKPPVNPDYMSKVGFLDYPDTVDAGSEFNIALHYVNQGNLTWSQPNFKVGSEDGVFGLTRQAVDKNVAKGEVMHFNLRVKAPNTEGTFVGKFQMLEEHKTWFGEVADVTVKVKKVIIEDPCEE